MGLLVQIAQLLQELIVRLAELEAVESIARRRRDLDRRDGWFLRGHRNSIVLSVYIIPLMLFVIMVLWLATDPIALSFVKTVRWED